jgi:ABC-type amino acid transport substrate-binding protein
MSQLQGCHTMIRRDFCSMVLQRFQTAVRAAIALGALALVFHVAPSVAAEEGGRTALQKIKQGGVLTVAFYKDYAPFSDQGKGIDVDLAEALAAKLGVKMSPIFFTANDKIDDDLRKMVWKGTPISSPADMMMHVPVDPNYMSRIKQIKVFGAYHRERFGLGRDLAKLPTLDNLEPFATQLIAVDGESMGGLVMASADGGRYVKNIKMFKSGEEAIVALKEGKVSAAIAQQGELEAGVGSDARYAIEVPPHPVLKMQQWVVGVAVKAEEEDLAKALQVAMDELIADGTVARIKQQHGVKDRKP